MKVQVYFNLHRKLWSIKALEGENKGKVIKHAKDVMLSNVKPKVSEAGRQRVLREKVKNVHAGLVGQLIYTDIGVKDFKDSKNFKTYKEITYNPYRYTTFVYKDDFKEYKSSNFALMTAKTVYTFE